MGKPRSKVTDTIAVEGLRIGLIEFLNVRLDLDEFAFEPSSGAPLPLPESHRWNRSIEPGESPAVWGVAEELNIPRSLGAGAQDDPALIGAPYLPFEVNAITVGIDIEHTPAWFLSWDHFGGPTTPTQGWILPGLYRFRGRDHKGEYRFDGAKFRIPPLQSASTII